MRFWKGDIETADPVARSEWLGTALAAHATAVFEASAFARERFRSAGVDPSDLATPGALADLPPVTKQQIIADQATAPPYGTMLGVPPVDVVRQYIGPGPQTTFFTAAEYDATIDDAAWAFWTMGFRPEDVIDNTIMYHWVIAGTVIDAAYRAIGCAVIPGGIGDPQMHIDVMRWSGVTGLFAFPTFLDAIEAKAREGGIEPAREFSLRLGCISGELRSDDAKERMTAFWGMEMRELYGGAEVPFLAADCGEGSGMHLNPDFVVEVLHPETDEPVAPGEGGVIVATDLRRMAYPMIRYMTGDITEFWDPEPCACGRTTARIGRILGRHSDIPRVKGLFLVPAQVRESLAKAGVDAPFQLVIDRPERQDTLTIRIEGDADPGTVARAVKEGTRLTPLVDLVPPGALAEAPTVDDRRTV